MKKHREHCEGAIGVKYSDSGSRSGKANLFETPESSYAQAVELYNCVLKPHTECQK